MEYKPYFNNLTEDEKEYIGLIAKGVVGRIRERVYRHVRDNERSFYVSYSGGLDSSLVMWFFKTQYDNGWKIPIVSVNNFMQYGDIRDQMYKYSDVVLTPSMTMLQVKESGLGIPVFSKRMDNVIWRYQKAQSRRPYLMDSIYGISTQKFKLNNKAGYLLTNNLLPLVSSNCCIYTKEKPLFNYSKIEKRNGIIGVRQQESVGREASYNKCRTQSGLFTPIYDVTDFELCCVYDYYKIDKVYPYTKKEYSYTFEDFDKNGKCVHEFCRTGCLGCPYSYHGGKTGNGLEREFIDMTSNQKKYAIRVFGESYKILGFDFEKFL